MHQAQLCDALACLLERCLSDAVLYLQTCYIEESDTYKKEGASREGSISLACQYAGSRRLIVHLLSWLPAAVRFTGAVPPALHEQVNVPDADGVWRGRTTLRKDFPIDSVSALAECDQPGTWQPARVTRWCFKYATTLAEHGAYAAPLDDTAVPGQVAQAAVCAHVCVRMAANRAMVA